MLKSKLSEKYPMISLEECDKWVIFKYIHQKDIDPIFLRRLGALAQYMNKVINIISGYRSTEEQIRLYIASGGKLVNGQWVGGSGFAARPLNSYHEFRLAIDTSSLWLKQLEEHESTHNQKILNKFGLYRPLTKGNKSKIIENWHLQPCELIGQTNRKKFAPEEIDEIENFETLKQGSKGEKVKELQQILKNLGYDIGKIDGDFGDKTLAAVKIFQYKFRLLCDGIVGQKTWNRIKEENNKIKK